MKVVVGCVHGEDVNGWFYHSMTGLHTFNKNHPEALDLENVILVRSGPLLSAGRGQLAATFLEHSKAEALIMLDSDMAFTPQMLAQMVQAFTDVRAQHGENIGMLGGLAFISNSQRLHTPLPNIWLPDPQIPEKLYHQTVFPRDSLIEVGSTGGACIIIHRQVFEAIGKHWFHHIPAIQWTLLARDLAVMDDAAKIEETMRDAIWSSDQLGEDMSFCIRARALGFRIFMHTGIIFDHAKSTLLGLEEYDRAVETHRLASEVKALEANNPNREDPPEAIAV